MQKRVSLSIEDSVYKEFQKACEGQDIIVSKRVERLMKEEIEFINKNKREKK